MKAENPKDNSLGQRPGINVKKHLQALQGRQKSAVVRYQMKPISLSSHSRSGCRLPIFFL